LRDGNRGGNESVKVVEFVAHAAGIVQGLPSSRRRDVRDGEDDAAVEKAEAFERNPTAMEMP